MSTIVHHLCKLFGTGWQFLVIGIICPLPLRFVVVNFHPHDISHHREKHVDFLYSGFACRHRLIVAKYRKYVCQVHLYLIFVTCGDTLGTGMLGFLDVYQLFIFGMCIHMNDI